MHRTTDREHVLLLAQEQKRLELGEMDTQIQYNEALIDERDQGIAEISQQIGEVNEIFQVRSSFLSLNRFPNCNGRYYLFSLLYHSGSGIERRLKVRACCAQDLAVLVNDQGLMLDDIESNIERTADRTRAAGSELVRAERYQRSSRNKMCLILLIVAFVLAVIVLVTTL